MRMTRVHVHMYIICMYAWLFLEQLRKAKIPQAVLTQWPLQGVSVCI